MAAVGLARIGDAAPLVRGDHRGHRTVGHDSPVTAELVRTTLAGIARTYAAAERSPRRRAPLLLDVRAALYTARTTARSLGGQGDRAPRQRPHPGGVCRGVPPRRGRRP